MALFRQPPPHRSRVSRRCCRRLRRPRRLRTLRCPTFQPPVSLSSISPPANITIILIPSSAPLHRLEWHHEALDNPVVTHDTRITMVEHERERAHVGERARLDSMNQSSEARFATWALGCHGARSGGRRQCRASSSQLPANTNPKDPPNALCIPTLLPLVAALSLAACATPAPQPSSGVATEVAVAFTVADMALNAVPMVHGVTPAEVADAKTADAALKAAYAAYTANPNQPGALTALQTALAAASAAEVVTPGEDPVTDPAPVVVASVGGHCGRCPWRATGRLPAGLVGLPGTPRAPPGPSLHHSGPSARLGPLSAPAGDDARQYGSGARCGARCGARRGECCDT